MFSQKQGEKLVELARKAIESSFTKEKTDYSEYEEFSEKQGVFVTLNKHETLRGCIGFPEPLYALSRAVVEAARSAAFSDPRFPPVSEEELDEITIEVSVLSAPRQVEGESPEDIKDSIVVGADGLIIKGVSGSGLLLPQVASEQGWDAENFLEHLCMKAGLPPDAWKDNNTSIYKFQAWVFVEKEPKGEVVEKQI